jgi:glycerophosphoryl diester phosphodiesterase
MHRVAIQALWLDGLALVLAATTAVAGTPRRLPVEEPIVIGHRGASGYVPEHTLASYFIAIQQGADFVEPDLVSTKGGALVARHEPEIGGTTDVADHPEFANRKTTKTIDGVRITGWFTTDFTLAELKTLRARERIPQNRPANTRFNGQFEVPTFDEVLDLVDSANRARARRALASGGRPPEPIGVYPETKHPTFFDGLGLSLEGPLLRSLRRHGYSGKDAPVFIQSLETANLRELRKKTQLPLIQLVEATGKPFDFVVANDPRTYADLASGPGLAWISRYADGVGANKNLVIPRNAMTRSAPRRTSCAMHTRSGCSSTSSRSAPRTRSFLRSSKTARIRPCSETLRASSRASFRSQSTASSRISQSSVCRRATRFVGAR